MVGKKRSEGIIYIRFLIIACNIITIIYESFIIILPPKIWRNFWQFLQNTDKVAGVSWIANFVKLNITVLFYEGDI